MTESELLAAEFYVALHRGTPNDVAYYQRAIQGASSVLELGCGNGRVLTQLHASPSDAPIIRVGVDSDAGMLALARRAVTEPSDASCRFVQADISAFDIGRKFDCIIMPYSTLWCLPDASKLECLRHAAKHAADQAKLFFDVYPADELIDAPDGASLDDADAPEVDEREFLVELEVRGERYRVFEEDRIWPKRPRVEAEFEFECVESPRAGLPRTHVQRIVHHPCRVAQLSGLLSASGFVMDAPTDVLGVPYVAGSGAQLFVSSTLRELSRSG